MTSHQPDTASRFASTVTLVILLLCLANNSIATDQTEAQLDNLYPVINNMASHGFENIRAYSQSGTLSVEYENRVYFREKDALKVIIPELMNTMPSIQTLVLFPSREAKPLFQLAISKDDYQLSSAEKQKAYDLSPISPEYISKSKKTYNSSIGKVDITIQPFANIALGRLYDPFMPQYVIAPEFSVFLGKGFKSLGRLSFLIYDELKAKKRNIALDALYIDYTYRKALLKNVSLNAGYFGENRYGLSSDAVLFGWRSRLGAGGSVSCLGNMYYVDGKIYYTKIWNWTALGDIYYRLPSLNMLIASSFGRFLHQDYGIMLKSMRFFNNASVSVFAAKTDKGRAYGLELQLLTYPRRNLKPYYVRLCLPAVIKVEYRYSESIVAIRFSPLYNNIDKISDGLWLMGQLGQ